MSTGNQVEKPRFFIDLLNYQYEIGNISNMSINDDGGVMNPQVLGFNPSRKFEQELETIAYYQHFYINFKNPISIPSNTDMFIAILGHDIASSDYRMKFRFEMTNQDTYTEIVNASVSPNDANIRAEYDGWTLVKFTPNQTDNINYFDFIAFTNSSQPPVQLKIGGLAMGFIYEPEFHADLKLNQSVLMDGVKNKQTKGGHTYSIINYTKTPNWWTGSAWELTDPAAVTPPVAFSNSRIGRRTWDISFSQLSDRFYTSGVPNGVFPANNMVNRNLADVANGNYSSGEDYDSETGMFNYDINNDRSLYSTVYHHTLGGTLPFIFSPSADNSPQNFSICRFSKPGFKVTQSSYKRFTTKMSIQESW